MSKLTPFLTEQIAELEKKRTEFVEVIADSIQECLILASKHFQKKISDIDYEVIKRGKKRFFFGEPFHIRAFIISEDEYLADLKKLDEKLTGGSGKLSSKELKKHLKQKDVNGRIVVKIYKHGSYLTVYPPEGKGVPATIEEIEKKIQLKGIKDFDSSKVSQIFKKSAGEPTLFSDQKPKLGLEGKFLIDVAPDKMKAKITLTPPKLGGRDLEVNEVISALKGTGIKYGIDENEIKRNLEDEIYNVAFTAAKGDPVKNGDDAEIIYHVRIAKPVVLTEDASGKVDFKNLNLIENVVVGKLLAEKIPPKKGKPGRDLFNQVIPATDGKDVELKQGKGTIISEDKARLTAAVNGQVMFANGRISVETVYRVNGDVGVKTGNVSFLGSVVITGNVEDNFSVKSAGNIEIYGTVQKANIKADGEIIIRQGISGREKAVIESTNGNIISKFVQNATVITEKDVIVQEGIVHSNISAGGKILCQGRRAQIVGGVCQAADLISAKIFGSSTNPTTELIVGNNPKELNQIKELEIRIKQNQEKLEQITKSLKTLNARKENDPSSFTEENSQNLDKLTKGAELIKEKINSIQKEMSQIQEAMDQKSLNGKISVEKTMHGGVILKIRGAEYKNKKDITHKTFVEENGNIRQIAYEDSNPKNTAAQSRGRGR